MITSISGISMPLAATSVQISTPAMSEMVSLVVNVIE